MEYPNNLQMMKIKHLILNLAANFSEAVVREIPESLHCGVYYGWASVDDGTVLPMVMSLGWNPYYNNTVKTMVRVSL